jgi:S1-C subfamily serine protease
MEKGGINLKVKNILIGVALIFSMVAISEVVVLCHKGEQRPNFNKIITSTVEIRVGMVGGAGIITKIDKDFFYILTAKHVVECKGQIDIQVNDSKGKLIRINNIPRENVFQDTEVDLALIKVAKIKGNFNYIPLSKTKLKVGDDIYTIGHPAGMHYTINKGIVSNYSKRVFGGNRKYYVMLSVPSWCGNSGGAVFNSKNELVGIVVGIMYVLDNTGKNATYLVNMTFAVQISDIDRLLKEYIK